MICGASLPKEIGKRYIGLADIERNWHSDQPYVVIREATLEEYIEYQKSNGFDFALFVHDPDLKAKMWAQLENGYYYEISID